MENIFQVLNQAEQIAQYTKDLRGKSYGLSLAIVADVDDPVQLGRIRVFLPSKGTSSTSDWLQRITPSPKLSAPLLSVGDTVVVGFFDGDTHQGCYLGVLNNVVNPVAASSDSLVVVVKDSALLVQPNSISLTVGGSTFVLSDGAISVSGVSSFQVNGKEVATVGAKDSRGDTIVSRGW